MAARVFDHGVFPVDGRPVTHSIIECGECGVVARYRHAGMRRRPPEAIEQYFRNHGWQVGRVKRADRCPDCLARSAALRPAQDRKEKPMAPATPPSATPPSATPPSASAADTPREMTRDDRRIIFAKIDEVYLGDRTGYAAPWTDDKVATDLGVPRAWVEVVRDEFFGASGTNPEIDALSQELAELRAEAGALASRLSACEVRLAKLVKGA